MGHCLCVLGDSMAMPVSAMVNKFRPEFEEVIASAAISGFPTTDGREALEDGEEPGPGGISPKVIERQRLAGRPVADGGDESTSGRATQDPTGRAREVSEH